MAVRDARGHFVRATEGEAPEPEDFPGLDPAAEETAPRDVAPELPKPDAKPKGRGGWPKGRSRGPRRTPAPGAAAAPAAKVSREQLTRSWSMLFASINAALGNAVGSEAIKLDEAEARACGEAMTTIMDVLGPVAVGKYVLLVQAGLTIGGVELAHIAAGRAELMARAEQSVPPMQLGRLQPAPAAEHVTPVPGRPFPVGLASDGQPLRVDPSTLGPAPVPSPVATA